MGKMKYNEGILLGLIFITQLDIKLSVLASPAEGIQQRPNLSQIEDHLIVDTFYDRNKNSIRLDKSLGLFCPDEYECAPRSNCSSKLEPEDIPLGNNSDTPRKCPGQSDVCCFKDTQNATSLSTDIRASAGEGKCGIRNVGGLRLRISSDLDDQADYGEFPWMVTILQKNYTVDGDEYNIYQGGGSLIHPSVVLTAAHRVHRISTNSLRIRAGEWDTQAKSNIFPHQDREVGQVVIHDSFNPSSLQNDFALVFLASPLDLADHIRPICLPPSDYVSDYQRCITSGWGKDSFSINATYATVLKKVNVPIVPLSDCEAILKTTRLGKYFQLDDSFVCAGGEEGRDSCNGDGGSPLMCSSISNRNQYYQVGIVAWGIGCGDNNIPGVYSNVAKSRGWIDKIVQEKGLTIDSYTTA